jgi:hypothetical protein
MRDRGVAPPPRRSNARDDQPDCGQHARHAAAGKQRINRGRAGTPFPIPPLPIPL